MAPTPDHGSRRSFLKTAGATATGLVAAPYVITSRALGDATTPPASDRIVMGGIGIGNQGSGDQNAFLGRPDVQYVIAPGSFRSGRIGELEDEPGISCGVWQMRPHSRGTVHIRSSQLDEAPAIAPAYLSDPRDARTLVEGLRIGRRLFEQPALARHVVAETVPGPQADTDEALLQYGRDNGSTVYHGVGTCRMGTDPLSVVDPELRVHRIRRLRVVDASVMPSITSTNTNATVLMIAERAAELLRNAGSMEDRKAA